MVILQFNKLIRNKWVWGVFAVAVSAAFCFDDLFRSSDSSVKSSSPLESLSVGYNPKLEKDCRDMMELFRDNPSARNRGILGVDVDKTYAAMAAFTEAGIYVSNKSLAQVIRSRYLAEFEYDEARYAAWIRQTYNIDVARFEELLRKSQQMQTGVASFFNTTAWVSPMELDQVCHDITDKFTVRVASFEQTKEEADAIKVDEDGLKTWFAENTERLHLPLRLRLRYVEFSASNTNLTAQLEVTPEEITARYEADKDSLYSSTDTNGVVTVKAEDEVKDEISRKLLNEKFMEKYDSLLAEQANEENAIIMDDPETERASLVEKIAKDHGLEVKVSSWVEAKASSGLLPGFARAASSVFPGAADTELVANLDPQSENYFRYTLLKAERSNRLWLVEASETSPAHDATFEECKGIIEAPALREAKQKAFEKAVAAVTEKGVDAVLASGKVSTEITFSPSDEKQPEIDNARQVMAEAVKLNKGEMSALVSTGTGKGIVVVCTARTDGALAALYDGERQALAQVLMSREFTLPDMAAANQFAYFKYMMKREQWLKANLKNLGYTKPIDEDEASAL